jgi:hypothetical protein
LMLLIVSEYVKGLMRQEGEILIPPKQLLVQLTDLMGFFEASQELGFFDFVKKYFHKK